MTRIDDILAFWFEGLNDNKIILKNSPEVKKWFKKEESFDSAIKEKFEGDLIKAKGGEYKSWEESARGRLALIILFDQFSRNIYRNTPKMFENDSLALNLTLHSIKDGMDTQLQLIERIFLYMPLMHSEALATQKLSLQFFKNLAVLSKTQNPENTPYFKYTLEYAKRHHDIIAKFGRFPHRNAILKRLSTAEESQFLQKRGSSF